MPIMNPIIAVIIRSSAVETSATVKPIILKFTALLMLERIRIAIMTINTMIDINFAFFIGFTPFLIFL